MYKHVSTTKDVRTALVSSAEDMCCPFGRNREFAQYCDRTCMAFTIYEGQEETEDEEKYFYCGRL